MADVSNLDFRYSPIKTLQVGDFDGLTGLQRLSLRGTRLTTLPEGVFDSLTYYMAYLRLNDNHLTALPEGVFDSLTNLEYLNLTGNYLVGLTRNDPLFAGLPNGVDLQLGGQTEVNAGLKPWMLYEGFRLGQEKRDNAGSDQGPRPPSH